MEGKYAFASYSHQDVDSVMPLVEALLARGFRIWIDRMQLVPGKDWSSEISGALGDARVLLWFAGRHSSTSQWMQAEARAMVSAGKDKIIIPVLVKGAEPEELPLFLRNRQWVDARSDAELAIDKLSEALVHYLGAPAKKPTEKATAKNKGYLFISYSVEDAGFLDDLKEFLRTKGYGYWDFHESKRNYQTQFHLELESIIRDSRAVLCIVTPSWKHSRWAPREYLYTEDIRKPIFLLRAERMEPTLLIAGSSYIDFVDDHDGAFRELDRELATAGL